MTKIKLGDWVRLVAGRSASGVFQVVQVNGDHLSLKRDHVLIHNVHLEDVAPAGARGDVLSA